VPVFFHTGSAHGIHPSERSPLARYPAHYRSDDPTCRLTCRCSRRRSEGPAQQASVPGISPLRESLASRRGFNPPTAGCSPGFCPSRVSRRSPCPGFRPNSSHALLQTGDHSPTRRRPRVSSTRGSPGPPPRPKAPHSDQATLLGFLHRLDSVTFRRKDPGLCVHLTQRPALLRVNHDL